MSPSEGRHPPSDSTRRIGRVTPLIAAIAASVLGATAGGYFAVQASRSSLASEGRQRAIDRRTEVYVRFLGTAVDHSESLTDEYERRALLPRVERPGASAELAPGLITQVESAPVNLRSSHRDLFKAFAHLAIVGSDRVVEAGLTVMKAVVITEDCLAEEMEQWRSRCFGASGVRAAAAARRVIATAEGAFVQAACQAIRELQPELGEPKDCSVLDLLEPRDPVP